MVKDLFLDVNLRIFFSLPTDKKKLNGSHLRCYMHKVSPKYSNSSVADYYNLWFPPGMMKSDYDRNRSNKWTAEMIRIIVVIKVSLETATKKWLISKKCYTISFEFPKS